jgi:hypothetical protein
MTPVYILEYKTLDSMNRSKKTVHVGVYSTLEAVEAAKQIVLNEQPNVSFEIYTSEHILFESQPE